MTATNQKITRQPRYPLAEEIVNAATHGIGAGLGIAALVLLILRAVHTGGPGSVWAVVLYGSALILLYTFSALHHGLTHEGLKKFFLSLDHAGIYLLIAGTYTPFALLLPAGQGWWLFGVIWGLAALGITAQTAMFVMGRSDQYEKIAFLFYLALGWFPILFFGGAIFGALSANGLWLLVAGGLSYSIGVIFYLWRSLPFNHAFWHVAVIGGSSFHFFCIFFFVVPAV